MIAAVLLLSLASPLLAAGQPSPTPVATGPALAVTGAFFALSVRDLEASAAWYREALGLSVVMRTPKQNGAAALVLEGGGLIVELIQRDGAMPLKSVAPSVSDRMLVQGLVKAGAVVADFDRTVARLREHHATIAFGPYPARPDQRANVIVQDNAGNLIQLFGQRQ